MLLSHVVQPAMSEAHPNGYRRPVDIPECFSYAVGSIEPQRRILQIRVSVKKVNGMIV